MQKYYKITNDQECHHGFQYKDGLNIDMLPFSHEGSCVAGGLYFTTAEYIINFFDYGSNVREIFLPTENPSFRMVMDPQGDKWRANMIILGKKYPLSLIRIFLNSLNDFEISLKYYDEFIDKFTKNEDPFEKIQHNSQILEYISNNLSSLLSLINNNKDPLKILINKIISNKVIYEKFTKGDYFINVTELLSSDNLEYIEFLRSQEIKMKMDIDKLLLNNESKKIKFLKSHGVIFNFCSRNLNNFIIQNRRVNRGHFYLMLEYLKQHILDVHELLLSENYDDIFFLIFSDANMDIKLSEKLFKQLIIQNGKVHRINLDYLLYIKEKKISDTLDISELLFAGNITDINYLKSFNLKLNDFITNDKFKIFVLNTQLIQNIFDGISWNCDLDFDEQFICELNEKNKLDVLLYLKNNDIKFKYPKNMMEIASVNRSDKLLEWWKNSGLSLEYTNYAMDQASAYGYIDVLEWWKNSGLPLKYSRNALSWTYNIEVLNWWLQSKLNINFNLNNRIKKRVEKETNLDIKNWWNVYQQNMVSIST